MFLLSQYIKIEEKKYKNKTDEYLINLICNYEKENMNLILNNLSTKILQKLINYCNKIIKDEVRGNKKVATIILNNLPKQQITFSNIKLTQLHLAIK